MTSFTTRHQSTSKKSPWLLDFFSFVILYKRNQRGFPSSAPRHRCARRGGVLGGGDAASSPSALSPPPPPPVPAACLCLGLCLSRCFFDKQKILCTMLRDHVGKLRAAPQLRLGILGFSGRRVHSGVWQCLAWVPAQPFTSYMVSGQFLHLPELQFPHSREGVTAKLAY